MSIRQAYGVITVLGVGFIVAIVYGVIAQVPPVPPTRYICFQYDLTINEAISAETAASIAREVQHAVPKIVEACNSIDPFKALPAP
jgi:hypothetical protein